MRELSPEYFSQSTQRIFAKVAKGLANILFAHTPNQTLRALSLSRSYIVAAWHFVPFVVLLR
jgi:hypothetical protein